MAAKVGIISDTHGLLRPEVMEILKTCDYILHAGDVTDERLLDQIRFFGKLYVVRGNCDGIWAVRLAQIQRFRIEELEFAMIHDYHRIGTAYQEADVVIYGHSHKYTEEVIDGRLWLNPGSCGYPRFGSTVSMAVMRIDGRHYEVERIDF